MKHLVDHYLIEARDTHPLASENVCRVQILDDRKHELER